MTDVHFAQSLMKQARTVVETKGIPPEKSSPTVLDAIYTSDVIGPEEKTLPRMMAETQALLGPARKLRGTPCLCLPFMFSRTLPFCGS